MSDWNPALYARFSSERDRPIADLLARVDLAAPKRIVDLGCGAGASTAPLLARWPQAEVLGIDTSPAMLEKARASLPAARFEEADAATWAPDTPVDLIFSNAALQWLSDHERLLPRLMGLLAPGGVLAVQMPDNLDEPSHALMRAVARRPTFAAALADVVESRTRIASIEATFDLLAPTSTRVDIWRTTYVHPLAGPDAIVEMISSTGLRPFLDALDETARPAFLDAYRAEITAAYPPTRDGRVLFRFPRLFFVATKA
ncbi:trans-aconitate 2-methyltransferase [Pinisolibacter aquiterrae]|uniref:trans-aconitate 2-methyltransferase n=1 Tax=Pinisolibacter aquiterrae TaxID=2815579 RepID=UPI001C3D1658|nr:trans-aconitate 2-methyltransferase [Pinisolibacter aquiterrae]MBV5264644.1 trans-aconitate 2-methyltransferase [Pinisolibacter aquiterrae]MCC8233413.1 trans-aconitate 2-methyltransferase [Pinisolibacter aquiterrae]